MLSKIERISIARLSKAELIALILRFRRLGALAQYVGLYSWLDEGINSLATRSRGSEVGAGLAGHIGSILYIGAHIAHIFKFYRSVDPVMILMTSLYKFAGEGWRGA